MSKNYFFGLMLAVAFLFAANVKADIGNSWGQPAGDELFSFTLDVSWDQIGTETGYVFKVIPVSVPVYGWSPIVEVTPDELVADSITGKTTYGATVNTNGLEAIESISGFSIKWDGSWKAFGAVTDLCADLTINGESAAQHVLQTVFNNLFNGSTAYFSTDYETLIGDTGIFDIEFTSNPGQNIAGMLGNSYQITFTAYGEYADGNQTPEPATLAIIGLGLAGLGVARARRRK